MSTKSAKIFKFKLQDVNLFHHSFYVSTNFIMDLHDSFCSLFPEIPDNKFQRFLLSCRGIRMYAPYLIYEWLYRYGHLLLMASFTNFRFEKPSYCLRFSRIDSEKWLIDFIIPSYVEKMYQ